LVEHLTENQGVASSNLALGTTGRFGAFRAEGTLFAHPNGAVGAKRT
jgi:hypothetical protein